MGSGSWVGHLRIEEPAEIPHLLLSKLLRELQDQLFLQEQRFEHTGVGSAISNGIGHGCGGRRAALDQRRTCSSASAFLIAMSCCASNMEVVTTPTNKLSMMKAATKMKLTKYLPTTPRRGSGDQSTKIAATLEPKPWH